MVPDLSILTWLVGIILTVLIAFLSVGLPWAYAMGKHVVKIEEKLDHMADHAHRLESIENRLSIIETLIIGVKKNGKPPLGTV